MARTHFDRTADQVSSASGHSRRVARAALTSFTCAVGALTVLAGLLLAPGCSDDPGPIGSGGATHNLGELGAGERLPQWAADFDTWLDARVRAGDAPSLIDYRSLAPNAARNHPTEDHYLPLLVALGAAGDKARGRTIHHSAAYGSLSLRAFEFS